MAISYSNAIVLFQSIYNFFLLPHFYTFSFTYTFRNNQLTLSDCLIFPLYSNGSCSWQDFEPRILAPLEQALLVAKHLSKEFWKFPCTHVYVHHDLPTRVRSAYTFWVWVDLIHTFKFQPHVLDSTVLYHSCIAKSASMRANRSERHVPRHAVWWNLPPLSFNQWYPKYPAVKGISMFLFYFLGYLDCFSLISPAV